MVSMMVRLLRIASTNDVLQVEVTEIAPMLTLEQQATA